MSSVNVVIEVSSVSILIKTKYTTEVDYFVLVIRDSKYFVDTDFRNWLRCDRLSDVRMLYVTIQEQQGFSALRTSTKTILNVNKVNHIDSGHIL
jgi:hypothetical protein